MPCWSVVLFGKATYQRTHSGPAGCTYRAQKVSSRPGGNHSGVKIRQSSWIRLSYSANPVAWKFWTTSSSLYFASMQCLSIVEPRWRVEDAIDPKVGDSHELPRQPGPKQRRAERLRTGGAQDPTRAHRCLKVPIRSAVDAMLCLP